MKHGIWYDNDKGERNYADVEFNIADEWLKREIKGLENSINFLKSITENLYIKNCPYCGSMSPLAIKEGTYICPICKSVLGNYHGLIKKELIPDKQVN